MRARRVAGAGLLHAADADRRAVRAGSTKLDASALRLPLRAACASTSASASGQRHDGEHPDDLPVVQEREQRRRMRRRQAARSASRCGLQPVIRVCSLPKHRKISNEKGEAASRFPFDLGTGSADAGAVVAGYSAASASGVHRHVGAALVPSS